MTTTTTHQPRQGSTVEWTHCCNNVPMTHKVGVTRGMLSYRCLCGDYVWIDPATVQWTYNRSTRTWTR